MPTVTFHTHRATLMDRSYHLRFRELGDLDLSGQFPVENAVDRLQPSASHLDGARQRVELLHADRAAA